MVEPLAATGIRSIRYLKEIPEIERLVCGDIVSEATEQIERNMKINKCKNFEVHTSDANDLLRSLNKQKK